MATADLARAGVLDILSSDYVPSSLLIAALRLPEERDEFDLPAAIRTVSKTPAEVVGLTDRGEIAVGKRADLIRVHQVGRRHRGAQRLERRPPRRMNDERATATPIGPGRLVLDRRAERRRQGHVIAGARAACGGDPTIVFPRRVVTRPATEAEDHDSLDHDAFDSAENDGGLPSGGRRMGSNTAYHAAPITIFAPVARVVCNVSRGIVAELRARYARVTVVMISAPSEVLAARLAGRSRATDGSLTQRVERNDAFAEFCADRVIENTGPPQLAAQLLRDVIYER